MADDRSREMQTRSLLPWGVAAVVIALGWLAGYVGWDSPRIGYERYFAIGLIREVILVGIPFAVVAGLFLRARDRRLRGVGVVCLFTGTLVLAFLASFVFFDMCLDPGEVCVTNWSSRVLVLIVAISTLAPGLLISARRR